MDTPTKNAIDSQYKHLAAAVIEKACSDYIISLDYITRARATLASHAPEESKTRAKHSLGFYIGKKINLERFFLGDYFQLMCSGKVTGESTIRTLRERAHYIPDPEIDFDFVKWVEARQA